MRCILLFLTAAYLMAPVSANGQSTSFLNRRVEAWRLDLEKKGAKPSTRRSAAFALGRLGSMASYAVPDLVQCVRSDRDAGVRDMAANALGDIVLSLTSSSPTTLWSQAGKALEEALDNDDPRVRRSAAYALGAFGPLAAPAVSSLKKAMRDKKSAAVRQNAAWALGRIGAAADAAAIADLCDLLADSNALVRRDAANALGNLGKIGKKSLLKSACKSLLDMVKSEKDDVARKTALGALAPVTGPENKDSAPDLYPLLEDKDPDTARYAAYALSNMGGEPAARAVPVLRKALRDTDSGVQELAAAALALVGVGAAPAVDDLALVLTESKDPLVRRNCAVALGQIGPDAKNAISSLAAALKPVADVPSAADRARPYEEVREQAAEAIAQIRMPNNERAMPAVREAIAKDPNLTVRHRCVWALFNMTEADLNKFDMIKVLEAVISETSDATKSIRYDSARVLAYALRDKAPDKVCDVLLGMIKDDTLKIFRGTNAAIDSTPDESKGGSTGTKTDQGGDARYMAADAMGWMGEKSKNNKAIVEALRKAATDPEPRLKKSALASLKVLGLDK
jgi:HEAT repeat protein